MEEDRNELNNKELDLVRDIFSAITKAIKTFNVYPKGNPIYQKFVTDLFEKFNAFFGLAEELIVDVGQYSLIYKENEVFRSEEKTDNIVLLLFADGLRQLSFHKGLTYDEVTDFVEVLRAALKSKSTDDDDIVTLLWERNIRNMGYTAVEDTVDDDLAVEAGVLEVEGSPEEEGMETTVSSSSFNWRPESGSSSVAVEPLSAAEITEVKNEIAGMGEKSLLSSAVDLFLELLTEEPEGEAVSEIMTNIGKIMDLELQRKNVPAVIAMLKGLKELFSRHPESSSREMLDGIMNRAGSAESLKTVFEVSAGEEVRKYLLLLDISALPGMIEVLAELQDRKLRKLLCEVLVEKGAEQIDTLAQALGDTRWYLVRNIVLILGLTKNSAAVKHLEKTLRHHDVRVRRETIRALEHLRNEDCKRLFLFALNDADVTVRVTSLKALRRYGDQTLFETLKKNASREELIKKSYAEKKELLETLAVLGGENAWSLLSELFKKGWLIEKDGVTELRAAAALGLGLVGTPEAVSLLKKEASSRKSLVKEACLKALRELEQGGNARK